MDQDDISYALNKQVPDMERRGFTIGTSYGQIDVPPGRVADAIARAVTRALQCELLAATKRAAHAKRQEVGQIALDRRCGVGESGQPDYVDRWAAACARPVGA